jgi:hypothetical protein
MKPTLFYQIRQRKKNMTISEKMGLPEEASNSPTLEETLIHSRPSGHSFKTNASDLRTRMIYSLRIIFLEDLEATGGGFDRGFSKHFNRDFYRDFAGLGGNSNFKFSSSSSSSASGIGAATTKSVKKTTQIM